WRACWRSCEFSWFGGCADRAALHVLNQRTSASGNDLRRSTRRKEPWPKATVCCGGGAAARRSRRIGGAPAGARLSLGGLLALEREQLLELLPALLGRRDQARFVLAMRRGGGELGDVVAAEPERE